ncbi:MAG: hypothetical protein AB8B91_23620 [Rubripirellula sp.]
MRHHFLFFQAFTICLVVTIGSIDRAYGQFETTITAGSWTAFLPGYDDLPNATIDDADQSGLGGRVRIQSQYDFESTRTIAEFRATIAGAEMGTERFSTSATGTALASTLKSQVIYNDVFIGLRDKFDLTNLGLGHVTLGVGFSHMHFDQSFHWDGNDGTANNSIAIDETIQSSYVGGEIVGSMTRTCFGKQIYLDGSVGMYDLDADFRGNAIFIAGGAPIPINFVDTFSDVAYTFNLTLKTDMRFAGANIRPTTGIQYISSMPGITADNGPFLRKDDAFILNGGWEFIF